MAACFADFFKLFPIFLVIGLFIIAFATDGIRLNTGESKRDTPDSIAPMPFPRCILTPECILILTCFNVKCKNTTDKIKLYFFSFREVVQRTTTMSSTKGTGVGDIVLEEISNHDYSDWMSMPKAQRFIKKGNTVAFRPIEGTLSEKGPWEIMISSNDTEYMILPLTRLKGKFSVVKNDGGKIADADKVSTINYLSNTLFNNVEAYVNNAQVEDISTTTYHYKAFLQKLLSYSKNYKDTIGEGELWIEDHVCTGASSHYSVDVNNNPPLAKRQTLLGTSDLVSFCSPIHLDLFQCPTLFPPKTKIKVRFSKNPDEVCIIGDFSSGFKIKLEELKIYVRKVLLTDEVRKYQQDLFEIKLEPIILKYPESQIITFSLIKGISNKYINILSGILPQSCYIMFVKSTAFSGDMKSNPFYFNHYNFSKFQLKLNGENYPAEAFEPDWTKDKNIAFMFRWFYDNIGIKSLDEDINISIDKYKNDKFILAYDFSPDLVNGEKFYGRSTGFLDIDITWKNPLTDTVTMLCYFVFEGTGIILHKLKGVAKLKDHQQLK
jgi:hypothetical protein